MEVFGKVFLCDLDLLMQNEDRESFVLDHCLQSVWNIYTYYW